MNKERCVYDQWSGRIPTCDMGFFNCDYSTCQRYVACCPHEITCTMELVWHSCTDCPPEEDYNERLFVTDGETVAIAWWRRGSDGWQRFVIGGGYIEPGVNSDGYWWADLDQTTRGFAPVLKSV